MAETRAAMHLFMHFFMHFLQKLRPIASREVRGGFARRKMHDLDDDRLPALDMPPSVNDRETAPPKQSEELVAGLEHPP
ncbi:hypothetical protein [Sorangium sp. So ce1000]|uniref:hypothetical protein n=1 Tax=Sorangium sp. So ce1000 TaxID=3133325 RepID=UPI003F6399F8